MCSSRSRSWNNVQDISQRSTLMKEGWRTRIWHKEKFNGGAGFTMLLEQGEAWSGAHQSILCQAKKAGSLCLTQSLDTSCPGESDLRGRGSLQVRQMWKMWQVMSGCFLHSPQLSGKSFLEGGFGWYTYVPLERNWWDSQCKVSDTPDHFHGSEEKNQR